jgi:hypothetical protein
MNRCVAFFLALCCACLTVSSACVAESPDWVHFTLEPAQESGTISADFRRDIDGREHNNWSSSFRESDLAGLDLAGFRAAGSRPLRFALIREAGRLDCVGHGGESYAAGNCWIVSDPVFLQLLASRGIGRPSREQGFGLIALDVRRDLIDAVAAAHYPTPTIDNIIEMTAVGVNGRYIADLARVGYRPSTLHHLVEFRAMDITPEWIGGFARIGYAGLPADQLVQLKALDISADYVAAFDRIGYRHIPAGDLVQMKALNIDADYVAGFERVGYGHLPVDQLVQLKALEITPDFARWALGQRSSLPAVADLVQMKIFDPRR